MDSHKLHSNHNCWHSVATLNSNQIHMGIDTHWTAAAVVVVVGGGYGGGSSHCCICSRVVDEVVGQLDCLCMQKLLILVKLMNRIKAAAEIKGGEIYEI